MRRKTERALLATEAQEQEALIKWAKLKKLDKYLFAIPNGGLRDKITAARLKRQGVKPGVSDLFFAHPSREKHGLFIEMKRRKGGKVTEAQAEFIQQCLALGYEARVANGWVDASEIIKNYLIFDNPTNRQ